MKTLIIILTVLTLSVSCKTIEPKQPQDRNNQAGD